MAGLKDAVGTTVAVDRDRLVALALDLVGIPSPTGSELTMANRMRDVLVELGLSVSVQEVEDGRPNVLGTWRASATGRR